MIANCPSCGTHYKHAPPRERARARCGRCDAALDLSRLRPYRIVSVVAPTAEQTRRAASHLPVGLDHPALATTIAHNVARSTAHDVARPVPDLQPVRSKGIREDVDPLPQIPEMSLRGIHEASAPPAFESRILQGDPGEGGGRVTLEDATADTSSPADGGAATFALWLATGAIAGTGASWTMGGATMPGMAAGAAFGAVAGWGWLRWTSSK